MANLNEYVLRYIFDYLDTPLDWIQVSQVCKLWREAAKKQWRRITEIVYLKSDTNKINSKDVKNAPVISSVDARRIVHYSAPNVKVLAVSLRFDADVQVVRCKFGQFVYNARVFKSEAMVELLARDAKNLTEIRFDYPPKPALLKLLIENNNIKKVKFEHCNNEECFFENISTEKIEELSVLFDENNISSFKDHFPNLKKLDLEIKCERETRPKKLLKLILPNVLGLTSFSLYISTNLFYSRSFSANMISNVANFSLLQHLSLVFVYTIEVRFVNMLITKVAEGCVNLRTIELVGIKINEGALSTLLSLPHLESANLNKVSSLRSLELPHVINLSRLRIEYHSEKLNVENFGRALRKMPKLEALEMVIDFDSGPGSMRQSLMLVEEVTSVAASQQKEVVVKGIYGNGLYKQVRIEKQNRLFSDEKIKTIDFKVPYYIQIARVESIQTFVREHLEGYYVVIEDWE